MQYPTLLNYIEAVGSMKGRLKTMPQLKPVTDVLGQPVYRTKGSVVYFAMEDASKHSYTIGLFLNHLARERYLVQTADKVYANEFFVHTHHGESRYVDLILRSGDKIKGNVKDKAVSSVISLRPLSCGLRAYADLSGKWGFMDHQDRVVIEPRWDMVEEFEEGRAAVEQMGRQGLIDMRGMEVIPPIYDEISWDGSQYAYCEVGRRSGVLDRQGNIVVPIVWDWVGDFMKGYAIVQQQDKYGYVNTKGETVIEPKYDNATSFNDFGYACVTLNDEEFHIDAQQRRV